MHIDARKLENGSFNINQILITNPSLIPGKPTEIGPKYFFYREVTVNFY
jgi:hypothetical protein